MTNEAAERLPITRKRMAVWLQEMADFMCAATDEIDEVEGCAFARPIQYMLNGFVGSAQRDLGITLKDYGYKEKKHWSVEQHNEYHRAAERRATVERIRAAFEGRELFVRSVKENGKKVWRIDRAPLDAILDAEAARET